MRILLALVVFVLLTLFLTNWPDPVAHDVMPYHTSGLTHGPMLGQPTSTSMRVWVRTTKPMKFKIVYNTQLPLTLKTTSVEGVTTKEADSTGFVTIRNLKPGTRYFYGVVTSTGLIDTRMEFDRAWPSFQTLPDKTTFADAQNNKRGLANFSFSIGCCMRQKAQRDAEKFGIYANPPSFLNLFKNHGKDISFHIVNGDFTYEETLDGTRAGYASNYKLYLRRGRNLANLFRYVPFMTMYDDHEVNSNLDGSGEIGLGHGDYLKRDDALSVWKHYASWANDDASQKGGIRFGTGLTQKNILIDKNADFSTLKTEQVSTIHVGHYIQGDKRSRKERGGANIGVYGLVKVIDKHRLQITPAFKSGGSVPYSIGTHHYFDRRISNCHFFFLDTRGERSKFLGEKKAHQKDRFILGEVQRRWFLDKVKKTDADFIFVISPDPWVIYHSAYHVRPEGGTGSKGDGFCGYVHEREILLKELDQIEKPILIFTGDVHNSFAVQITNNVWEFMCGPMNSAGHPIGTAGLPPFGGWFDSEGRVVKVKWVAGFPDNVHYSRLRNTYYAVVKVNNVMKAPKPKGVGYQFVSYDEPQVVVQFYDGYTGKLVYAEGISTADARKKPRVAPKVSRWPFKKR